MFIDIDWSSILPVAAAVFCFALAGVVIGVGICVRIGQVVSRRRDQKVARVIAETPDEVFLTAIRNFEGV